MTIFSQSLRASGHGEIDLRESQGVSTKVAVTLEEA